MLTRYSFVDDYFGKMIMKKLFVALLLSLAFISCAENEIIHALSEAEVNMQEDPERSLKMLESIDAKKLTTRKQTARHALLHSIALDKNYIDIASDSIIAPAVRYYSRHGSTDDKLLTLYYEARIQYNAQNYNEAVLTLMETLPLFEESSQTRYFSLIHNLFVAIYNMSSMFDDALIHVDKAYGYAVECGDMVLSDVILYRKAQLYTNEKRYADAVTLYEKVLNNARLDSETESRVMCDLALSLLLKEVPDYGKAKELYESSLKQSSSFYDANHWGAFAYSLSRTGNKDKSEQIFDELSNQKEDKYINSIYNSWKQFFYRDTENFRDAYFLLKDTMPYQDSVFRRQLQYSAAKAQRDYLALKKEDIEKEYSFNRMIFFLVATLLVLLVILLYFTYIRRVERIKREKESLVEISEAVNRQLSLTLDTKESEIHNLRSHIRENDRILAILRAEHIQMYKSQFKALGELCEVFVSANEHKESHKFVYERVRSMLKDFNGDESSHLHFEKKVNKSLNNIMKHFREDFPDYKEEDYRFLTYLIIGFDATTISIICNIPTQAAVYMKKSRIKNRIRNSTSDFKEHYLEMIG